MDKGIIAKRTFIAEQRMCAAMHRLAMTLELGQDVIDATDTSLWSPKPEERLMYHTEAFAAFYTALADKLEAMQQDNTEKQEAVSEAAEEQDHV